MKFVVVNGGVCSALGKGITASSIGVLLQNIGMSVTAIKIDPYLNIDASLIRPSDHGEVYTLSDGSEVDLDFGSYERFLDIELTGQHSITSGKIYSKLIAAERAGDYLGETVQIIPHLTDCIQEWLLRVAKLPVKDEKAPDVCIVELGGTIGDIESMPFVEALRQLQSHPEVAGICNVHVSLLPIINEELKTKPIQNSVSTMRSNGLYPDILICRHSSMLPVPQKTITKVSKMCGISTDRVIALGTEKILWKVPIILQSQNVTKVLCDSLALSPRDDSNNHLMNWKHNLVDAADGFDQREVRIVIVGKYSPYTEAYLSVIRALQHAAFKERKHLMIDYFDAGNDGNPKAMSAVLEPADGILVPGGFGERGNEMLIKACAYARVKRIPFLGICLGFQMAVIEYARNVWGELQATSAEFDDTGVPVVIHMPDYSRNVKGASMRLGSHMTKFTAENSLAKSLYGNVDSVSERHRHRYEVNPKYISELKHYGLQFTGTDSAGTRMQILELSPERHPFYVGCQFHPEFQSRPLKPAPLFSGFIRAAINYPEKSKSSFGII